MVATERAEARIRESGSVLVVSAGAGDLAQDFCGTVVTPDELAAGALDLTGTTVYLSGDASRVRDRDVAAADRVFVVDGSVAAGRGWPVVDRGRVPVRVHGLGVYYRRFFDPAAGHFARVRAEHAFQALTESTKPGTAYRTGIYLTPVERAGDELHFRLLRCSTNLAGPTENFGPTDREVVGALNREAGAVLAGHGELNHVLAQVYHNTPAGDGHKQSKARISAHADKTKDMPANGVLAFCTFYDGLDRLGPVAGDPWDLGHRGASGLTRLQFRLKGAGSPADGALPAQFAVTLYPGSVLFVPLSTNRLYTHEVRPPALDAGLAPTRLGYVVRCSAAAAVHAGGRTFLAGRDGTRVGLGPPTPEGVAELRRLYAEENTSRGVVDYGAGFPFSLDGGDYLAPRL